MRFTAPVSKRLTAVSRRCQNHLSSFQVHYPTQSREVQNRLWCKSVLLLHRRHQYRPTVLCSPLCAHNRRLRESRRFRNLCAETLDGQRTIPTSTAAPAIRVVYRGRIYPRSRPGVRIRKTCQNSKGAGRPPIPHQWSIASRNRSPKSSASSFMVGRNSSISLVVTNSTV